MVTTRKMKRAFAKNAVVALLLTVGMGLVVRQHAPFYFAAYLIMTVGIIFIAAIIVGAIMYERGRRGEYSLFPSHYMWALDRAEFRSDLSDMRFRIILRLQEIWIFQIARVFKAIFWDSRSVTPQGVFPGYKPDATGD